MIERTVRFWKRMIAMVCMAVMMSLAFQTTVAALDHIAHALDVPHEATELAGQVASCDGDVALLDCADPASDIDHAHVDEGHNSATLASRQASCAPVNARSAAFAMADWFVSGAASSPDRRPPRA